MFICIIAGGSGTRLWPLSTPKKPKQILPIVGNKTLIKYTYDLVAKVTDSSNIFIVSEKTHYKTIIKQLSGFKKENMIVEPYRKGIFNCIALAYGKIKTLANQPIVFVHADHIVDNEKKFISSIKKAYSLSKTQDSIVIGGKKPNSPQSKYGYVECKISHGLCKVLKFIEKPPYEKAKILIKKQNIFWNEGFFISSFENFISEVKTNNKSLFPDIMKLMQLVRNKKSFVKMYKNLKKDTIECVLLNKSTNLLLSPISFVWTDVGTFDSIYSLEHKDKNKNVIHGRFTIKNVKKSLLINQTKINFIINSLDDIAVIATVNGIVIADLKIKKNLLDKYVSEPMLKKVQTFLYNKSLLKNTSSYKIKIIGLDKKICIAKNKIEIN